jgi:ATP-GRASP peptide maturase of grasp-with-spasm system
MILIQSATNDFSTSAVVQWLSYWGIAFIRLNDLCTIENVVLDNEKFIFKFKKELVESRNIHYYWYRRGRFEIGQPTEQSSNPLAHLFLNKYVKNENAIVIQTINNHLLNNTKNLGNYDSAQINKIHACTVAEKNGFKIPKFLITTSKKDLLQFFKKYGKIITKSIFGLPGFSTKTTYYSCKTVFVNLKEIDNTPENFGVSLFQEYIVKKIELRIFFLNEEYFASAIFSQADPQTEVDFRNYNRERPNRVVPYLLPDVIVEKLKKINFELGLKTGSCDLIVTPKGEYVFLEVNPIGQFNQVSLPCNYYLEKKIANELSNG